MRQDVITGLTISALVHAGVFLSSSLSGHHVPVRPPSPPSPVNDRFIELKPDPAEEIEKVDTGDSAPPPTATPPPMQADRVQVAAKGDFTQAVQPLLPSDLLPVPGVMAIPNGVRTGPGHGLPRAFDPSSLDEQPVARLRTPPQYPFEMRQAGTSGEVVVDFIVDESGSVRDAYVVRSSQREFEQAAVQAVSKWKFKPGRKAGRAVSTHMQVPIVFSLNNE